ncbi:MAG: hypothetical protein IJA14_01965 [Alphaproteobacteria bacterium]|nr:hypothetical protein [Alphaproteobacteria bacterium]
MKRNFWICSTLAFIALSGNNVDGMAPGRNNYQNLTVGNSFTIVWNCRTELERLGIDPREVLGIYRYGVAFDLLVPDCRNALIAADDLIARAGRRQNPNGRGAAANFQIPQPRPVHVGLQPVHGHNQPGALPVVQNQVPNDEQARGRELQLYRDLEVYMSGKILDTNATPIDEQSVMKALKAPKLIFSRSPGQDVATALGIVGQFNAQNFVNAKLNGIGGNFKFTIVGDNDRVHEFLNILSVIRECYVIAGRLSRQNPQLANKIRIWLKLPLVQWVEALRTWCNNPGWLRFNHLSTADVVKLTAIATDPTIAFDTETDPTTNQIRPSMSNLTKSLAALRGVNGVELEGDQLIEGQTILTWLKKPYKKGWLLDPINMFKQLPDQQKRQVNLNSDQDIQNLVAARIQVIDANERFTGENISERDFFNMLALLADLSIPNLNPAGQMRLNTIRRDLLHRWIEILQNWCMSKDRWHRSWLNFNNVSEEDIQKLRSIASRLSPNIFSRQDLLVLNGEERTQLRNEEGIRGTPILFWMETHSKPVLEQKIVERSGQFIHSFLPNVNANDFMHSLSAHDSWTLSMLSLKPLLIRTLFDIYDQHLSEKDIVKIFMPQIWESLEGSSHLIDCLVASSFGRSFSVPIFSKFVLNSFANNHLQVPQNEAKALTMQFLPLEMRDTNEKVVQVSGFIDELTTGTPGIFGDVRVQNAIYPPKLYFPILSFKNGVRNRIDALRQGQGVIDEFFEASRYFDSTDERIQNAVDQNRPGEVNFWTELHNAYTQDTTARDTNFRRLRNLINNNPDDNRSAALFGYAFDLPEAEGSPQEHADRIYNDLNQRLQRLVAAARQLPQNQRMTAEEINRARADAVKISTYDAIGKYNVFATALQEHIDEFVHSTQSDRLMQDNGTKISDFLNTPTSFTPFESSRTLWISDLLQPTLQQGYRVGMLRYVLNRAANLQDRKLFMHSYLLQNGPKIPYLQVHSDLLNYLRDIDARLSIALAQHVYLQSFVNLFAHPIEPLRDPAVRAMRDLLVDQNYVPVYDIAQIGRCTVYPNNDHYGTAVLDSLIPQNHLALFNTHDKLKRRLTYYLLKGAYLCMTNDSAFTQRYGGYSFPAQYPQNLDQEWGSNTVNTLFNSISNSLPRNMNVTPQNQRALAEQWAVFFGANGDVADAGRFRDAADTVRSDLISACSYIWDDPQGQGGVFCNEHIVRFIVDYLMTTLDDQNPTIVPHIFGLMTNRWRHCVNGRSQGTLALLPQIFSLRRISPTEDIPFNEMMGVMAFAAAQGPLQIGLKFGVHHSGQVDTQEEATRFGYAMSILGEKELFGLSDLRNGNGYLHPWESVSSLKYNFINQVLSNLPNKPDRFSVTKRLRLILDLDRNLNGQAPLTQNELTFKSFLQHPTAQIPQDIQDAINAINDVSKREEVQTFCDCLSFTAKVGSNDYGYKDLIQDIAKRVATPRRMIDYFMKEENRAVKNLLLNAYKKHKRLQLASVENLNTDKQEKMIFDAFAEFGVFQGAQPAAH